MNDVFRFAAAASTAENLDDAERECAAKLETDLGGSPDLLVAFYSHQYGASIDGLPARLNQLLKPRAFIGCTGESIVAEDREYEARQALSVWGARLPGVTLAPMHLRFERTAEGPMIAGWPDEATGDLPAGAALLLLGEPFTFPADWLLERLNEDRPGTPVVGGMASGGTGPGQNRIALGEQSLRDGAVAVLLSGPLEVRTVVSQGCRPIGESFVITEAEQQWIKKLGGRPPLDYLKELFPQLPERDRRLVNRGLHVGSVINEYKPRFERGDFLIRNCLGADQESGAMAAADYYRRGQTVQFHVRDAESADADLRELLATTARDFTPAGGLMFTCNGRGTRLFDVADHDAAAVQAAWPKLPLAGFFAQGEIGPVGGKNFMHGYTASVVLFAPNGGVASGEA